MTPSLPMKALRGGPVLKGIVWNSLAGISVLLHVSDITEAKHSSTVLWASVTNISFNPVSPIVCETLTVQWPAAPSYTSPYTVRITNSSNESALQILFQTTAPFPTSSVEWLVNATGGSQLHLAILAQRFIQGLGTQPEVYATDFRPDPGYTTNCITSDPVVTPPITPPTSTATSPPTPPEVPSGIGSLSAVDTATTITQTVSVTATTLIGAPSGSTSTRQPGHTGSSGSGNPRTSGSSTSAAEIPSSVSISPPTTVPSDEASSRSASTSHSPSGVAIAGVVVGLLAVIALVIFACCLLQRMRARSWAAGAQVPAVSPYPSYFGWLPRKSGFSHLSYQASQAESLCSDSQLSVSEAESKQPLAVWNPRRFMREQAATPARVASAGEIEGAPA